MNRRLVLALAAPAFFVTLVLGSLMRIGPHEVGVRTDNFGGGGIVSRDFAPGWHLNLPLLHTWNVLPASVRRVEMTKDPRHRSALGSDALLVQSSDGDRVLLDVHVFYRIAPGAAHRLLQDSGSGDAHLSVLNSLAKDRLRTLFGALGTEQFYDPAAREERSRAALEELRAALAPRFLEPVAVLVQDVEFEPKYEQKIKDKKLADQNVELNKAQGRAAAERAKVAAIRLQTTREVQLIATRAEAEAARLRAEADKDAGASRAAADLYREQLAARGGLLLAQAEAKVKQAKTEALGGRGGANLVALEAAKNLKVDTISFPTTGSDWFDVREMATRLGARP